MAKNTVMRVSGDVDNHVGPIGYNTDAVGRIRRRNTSLPKNKDCG